MRIKITAFVDVPDGYRGCSMEASILDAVWDSLKAGTSSENWAKNIGLSYEKTEVPANSKQE